jgi:hypothetical protein
VSDGLRFALAERSTMNTDKQTVTGSRIPASKRETVREWKDRCEVNDRTNLLKYHEILSNANFVLANSTDQNLRAFAQVIINISEREAAQ